MAGVSSSVSEREVARRAVEHRDICENDHGDDDLASIAEGHKLRYGQLFRGWFPSRIGLLRVTKPCERLPEGSSRPWISSGAMTINVSIWGILAHGFEMTKGDGKEKASRNGHRIVAAMSIL